MRLLRSLHGAAKERPLAGSQDTTVTKPANADASVFTCSLHVRL